MLCVYVQWDSIQTISYSFPLKIPAVPCMEHVVSCGNNSCVCRINYGGAGCCTPLPPPTCNLDQDIYFLIDTTISNDVLPFCETLYTVEMLSRIINKGNNSRFGAYFYPTSKISPEENMRFIDIEDDGCEKSVQKLHFLVLQFSFGRNKGYGQNINGFVTLPARTIDLLRKDILASMSETPTPTQFSVARRRVAIIITDGKNDGDEQELSTAARRLAEDTGTTVIATGLGNAVNVDNFEEFERELQIIANGAANNVIAARDASSLSNGLVMKMAENGVICANQGNTITTLSLIAVKVF